ncbi:MAG: hypothetical protein ACYC5M_07625 [Anaerolineae bacterium]
MTRERGAALVAQVEKAIARIKGVTASKVILDADDQIVEVHVVAGVGRRPKQIVRDTESLLCAYFGTPVDYRKISLAQLSADGLSESRIRLRLIKAQVHPQRPDCVQVILQNDDRLFEGVGIKRTSAAEPDSEAAADATLSAVMSALEEPVALRVRQAQTVVADGSRVALVVVSAVTPRTDECLTGTCIVGECILLATAKATLDAINRRLVAWSRMATLAPPSAPPPVATT